jgi:beta-glucanase (GH16 family)
MKIHQYLKILTFFLTLSLSSIGQVTDTLTLIWADEFDGNELDDTKWATCPEWKRQGGSYWSPDNAWLNGNGQLKLNVTERNDSVFCGAIRTHNRYNQKYGYFEVRCRVPQIHGGWAAFWLMPYGNKVGSLGNDGTEMDVFESINGWNGKVNQALHWDGYGADHQKESQSMTNWGLYDGQYHIFGMMWTPDEYVFYIDNVETWRTSAGGVSDVEQYMKLTMEVSNATWPGDWNNQTTKPITWTIDYVRTYQLPTITNTKAEIEKSSISIYPNPSNNEVVVKNNYNTLTAYCITSLQGKEVLNGSLNSTNNRLDISSLSSGIYILNVAGDQVKIVKN